MTISGVGGISGVSGAYRVYFHLNRYTIPNNLSPIRRVNFPIQNMSPYSTESTSRSWQIGSFYSIINFLINNQGIGRGNEVNFLKEEKAKENCSLCQGRRYVCSNGETSDGISTIIPGRQSALRVQHHEAQHLREARIKALQEGKVVISQHIYLQHAICPECGGSYVSSGQAVTHTLSKEEFQALIKQTPIAKPIYQPFGRINDQRPEGKGINIDCYG
jgi:hypothetical protein